MKTHPTPKPSTPRTQRVAAAIAAVTVSASLLAVVLLAFHGSSPQIWLAPTPEVMEMVANCDRLTDRQTRELCIQQQVAARLGRSPGDTRVAQR